LREEKLLEKVSTGKESETLKGRIKKKLTANTTWFKKKKRKEIGEMRQKDVEKTDRDRKKETGEKEDMENGNAAKAVIFVPHTWGSLLAKDMRKKEVEIEKLTGYKFKIQEKVGEMLERILVKSNPWSGQDCARDNCLLCLTKLRTGKLTSQSCSKRSAVYETWCETCKKIEEKKEGEKEKIEGEKEELKLYKYIGETNRSAFERGFEHLDDLRLINPGSHLLKHILEKHESSDIEEIEFGMKVVKFHRSSFERQVHEQKSFSSKLEVRV
jgi:hypothetical protein